jgi:uncharacterized lipoprotein YajG
MMKRIVVCVTFVGLSGCAFAPQKATIDPHVQYMQSNVGAGKAVSVSVIDERSSKNLGHRGTAYGAAASITTDQNVAAVFQRAIFNGLAANGFRPLDYNSSVPRQLQVQIRTIRYSTQEGFWTGGITTKAAIQVRAQSHGHDYLKFYRYADHERVVVVPTASHNAQLINEAVDGVLKKMFSDPSLMMALSEK